MELSYAVAQLRYVRSMERYEVSGEIDMK